MKMKFAVQILLAGGAASCWCAPTCAQPAPAAVPEPAVDTAAARQRIAEALEALTAEAVSHGGWDSWRDTTHRQWLVAESRLASNAALKRDGDFVLLENGFLYGMSWLKDYFPEVFYEDTAPGKAALESIGKTADWLRAQGVHLIVVPIPPRFEVSPESVFNARLALPHRKHFIRTLLDRGVDALDIMPVFERAREDGEPDLSLKTDSHYNNTAIGLLAEQLAAIIRSYAPDLAGDQPRRYHREPVDTQVLSALHKYLSENSPIDIPRYEPAKAWRVLENDDTPFSPDGVSPVLVIGDSYTYVFENAAASLPAQLSCDLNFPVAHIGISGGGPAVPARLARIGADQVRTHRIIVWAFAARYVTRSGWERNPLKP